MVIESPQQGGDGTGLPTGPVGGVATAVAATSRSVWRSPRLLLAIGLALGVLATVVLVGKENLRSQVREQITRRDAEILYAVALMHQQQAAASESLGLDERIEQFNLMLEISRLKGVIAVRLYSTNGECLDVFPPYVSQGAPLPKEQVAALTALKPVSEFRENVRLSSVFNRESEQGTVPLLEVLVPLHAANEARLGGIAQFVIEGKTVANEYAELAHNLNLQSAAVFLAGATLLIIGLSLAFQRLERSNRLLQARTESLLRANEELVLAAKTSAVGTVTSHLLHGLKNPLAGIHEFVSSGSEGVVDKSRWKEAEEAANRMRSMIYDILDLLRQDSELEHCDFSLKEVADMVTSRVRTIADDYGVQLVVQSRAGNQVVSSKVAQLTSLILVNVVQNGIEATPRGGQIQLTISEVADGVVFRVKDQGPGISEELAPKLFSPGRTTKTQGSGLGLALCKQMAVQLGAELTLKDNSTNGCVFELALPHTLVAQVPSPAHN